MELKESLHPQSPNHWSKISMEIQQVELLATAAQWVYVSGHTRPDITFAVNCCARYMFCPKHSHELALKQIGRYLKQTPDQGMVMNPSSNVCKIDAYPDADFAGMYGHEEHTDPACAKSQTED